jgi:phage host-nuclease inhibitor protein Gam
MKPEMNRIKLPTTPMTRDDAIALLGEIRLLTIRRQKVILDREAAVKLIDDRVGPVLAEADADLGLKAALLKTWSDTNPAEFASAKSIESLHGTFGYRVGNPTVKPLAGMTWDKILFTLKQLGHSAARYIRTTEEVDKRALLADRDQLDDLNRKKIGVKFVQSSTFFADPKLDDPSP